ncbi:MAG: disulfide bond formation protein B, partial [bacterium]|nr:disulfide bond formation protein B [bacterium]
MAKRDSHMTHPLAYVAWAQALVATSGSLYFSEVAGYLPCMLCWYQRIA